MRQVSGAGYFFYPAIVPSAFKRSSQKNPDHSLRQNFGYKSGRKGYDVGIVVLPRQGCGLLRPTQRTADTLVFVGGDCNAVAAAANDNTKISQAIFNRFGHGMRKVRIIHRFGGMCTKILHHVPSALQHRYQAVLVRESGMVATYSNFHG